MKKEEIVKALEGQTIKKAEIINDGPGVGEVVALTTESEGTGPLYFEITAVSIPSEVNITIEGDHDG